MSLEERLIKAIDENRIYDFIANEYPLMTTYQLKEVILALFGICYDRLQGVEDENSFMEALKKELIEGRGFLEE